MNRLDQLIQRARDTDVREDVARARLDELGRWARSSEPRSRGWPWVLALASAATAATAVLVTWFVLRDPPRGLDDVRLGDRVAIVASPGARYRVETSAADRTTIAVDHGTLTARLWPGPTPHALVLRGGGVEARATGTVYALSVDERGTVVEVHEGRVAVTDGTVSTSVAAGTSWPAGAPLRARGAAAHLLALVPPAPSIGTADPSHADDAAVGAADAAQPADDALARTGSSAPGPQDARTLTRAATTEPRTDAGAGMTARERWRLVRLYRGQGKLDAALAECDQLEAERDRTWSPIALVECARIELGPMAAPERAIDRLARFARDWPEHQLASEARELRCRALAQLGRQAECGTP